MAIKVGNGQTILFIGDSITDCGRRAAERPLGNGYVKLFSDMVTIREPAKRITVINKGIGGDVVPELRDRWGDDVLRHRPDWLSVKIGINDLRRTLLRGGPAAVPPELCREAYDDILGQTRKKLPACRMLLIEPFYIRTAKSKTSFHRDALEFLPEYLGIVREMSRKYRTRRVRTHEMFQKLLRYHEAGTFCGEPVHPYLTGHLAIAEAVYEALSR